MIEFYRSYRPAVLSLAAAIATTALATASLHAATIIIPSPSSDLLLSSNGGVADINGSTADGTANYSGLPAANLNDGDRAGNYGNGGGVDGQGSIAHTAGAGANNEMGVTLANATLFGTVDIFNRTDCCGDRIDGNHTIKFTLNVFNGSTSVFSQDYTFTPTIALTNGGNSASGMEIPVNVTGTYVQVIQHNANYMNLAEIEAFTPEPASLSLLGLGAASLLVRRPRR